MGRSNASSRLPSPPVDLCPCKFAPAHKMLQGLSSLGATFAAALLGAAALTAAHFRPSAACPTAPAPADAAPSSEQGTAGKASSPSGAVALTASPAVSRRATPFPPLLGAATREDEIRMLKQKAAVAEESERRWRAQGEWQPRSGGLLAALLGGCALPALLPSSCAVPYLPHHCALAVLSSPAGKDQLAQLSRDTLHRCQQMIQLLEQEASQFKAVVGGK